MAVLRPGPLHSRPGRHSADAGRARGPGRRGHERVTGQAWPAGYEIRVGGVLDSRWADWFGGLQAETDGTQTVISVMLADQPALHGLLARIGGLGLCLISARRVDPCEAGDEAQP